MRCCLQAAKSASKFLASFFFLIVLFSSGTPTFAFCARQRRETGRRGVTVKAATFRNPEAHFFVLLFLEISKDAGMGRCSGDKHLEIAKALELISLS